MRDTLYINLSLATHATTSVGNYVNTETTWKITRSSFSNCVWDDVRSTTLRDFPYGIWRPIHPWCRIYAHFGNMLLVTHPDIQYHYQCNQVYIRNPDMILSLHKLHRDGIGWLAHKSLRIGNKKFTKSGW